MRPCALWLMLAVVVPSMGAVHGQPVPAQPRRVFALHSGVHIAFSHPWKNHAAEVLRDQLIRRKVPARDIVVLDCPFPTATWQSMVPRDGLIMFLEAMDPKSRFTQDLYTQMHK